MQITVLEVKLGQADIVVSQVRAIWFASCFTCPGRVTMRPWQDAAEGRKKVENR